MRPTQQRAAVLYGEADETDWEGTSRSSDETDLTDETERIEVDEVGSETAYLECAGGPETEGCYF